MSAICASGTVRPWPTGTARSFSRLTKTRSSRAPRVTTSICLSPSRKAVTAWPESTVFTNCASSCEEMPSTRARFWSITSRITFEGSSQS
jgi:hypothetical protein